MANKGECSVNIVPEKLIIPIASAAAEAYYNHKTEPNNPIPFSSKERLDILVELLNNIAKKQRGGNITTTLNEVLNNRDSSTARAFDGAFKVVIDRFINALNLSKYYDPSPDVKSLDPDSHVFYPVERKERDDIYNACLKKYGVKESGKPTVTQEPEGHKVKDIETKSATIRRLLGKMNTRHVTPMLDYFKNIVSTSWVDTRVIDGEVKGFTSLRNVVKTTQETLKERIYDYFAGKSVGTFAQSTDSVKTRYIVYTNESKPFGISAGSLVEIAPQVYTAKQAELTSVFGNEVQIIIAPTLTMATDVIGSSGTGLVDKTAIDYKGSDAYTKYSLSTNPDNIDQEDLPAYFAYMLSNPAVFQMFIKSEYPSLDKAYKERFKANPSEPGTVSGPDQDSAAVRLHKQSTPKLIVSPGTGTITIDKDQPFLTTDDFNSVAFELSNLGSTVEEIANGILDMAKHVDTPDNKKSILYSIYHRFFNPSSYVIKHSNSDHSNINPEGDVEYKSYLGVVNSHIYKELGLSEYESLASKDRKTANSALQDSLSAMITSLRTIDVADKASMLNRFLQRTNIRGNGLNLDAFNREYIQLTSPNSNIESHTNPALLKDEITISKGEGSTDGNPRLKIRIYTEKKVKGSEKERPYIEYTVAVNISKVSDTGKLVFTNGKPLTVLSTDKKAEVTSEDLAKIFSKFMLPKSITSNQKRNIQKLRAALITDNKGEELYAEDTNVTLDTFYLNMVFPMILNGRKEEIPATKAVKKLIPVWPDQEDNKAAMLPYTPKNSVHGYNQVISDLITRTIGENGKSKSISYSGNQLSSHTMKNNIKFTKKLAERLATNPILQGNLLTIPESGVSVEGSTFTKNELKQDDTVKGVGNFTEKENAIFLIEAGMLQPAYFSTDKGYVLMQIGTQSDRLHPILTAFKIKDGLFMKGRPWNMTTWTNDIGPKVAALSNKTIDETEINSISNIKLLKSFLERNEIPYNEELKSTGIFDIARVYRDNNGNAYISPISEEDANGLDTNRLARKALYVHQNYYNNINTVSAKTWTDAINSSPETEEKVSFTTLEQVAEYLSTHDIEYNNLRTHADLVGSMMVTSKKVTREEVVNGKTKKVKKTVAAIPEETLQAIAVFSDDMLGLEYIETMRSMFLDQLDSVGYRNISPSSVKYISNMMGERKSLDPSIAKSILFDTYFYYSQILGVSALNLHSHGTAQYDSKPKSQPLLKSVILFKDGKLNTSGIVEQTKVLSVPVINKTLEDTSVDEILDLREKALRPGYAKKHAFAIERLAYMKAILENNVAFPTEESKAKALLFNDLTRHLNDKFVTQVKRNQVYGSGLQLLRIVGDNEPGFFLPKVLNEIVVKDDEVKVQALGMSGESKADATDGVQEYHPLWEIMYNNSVGNNESSFRADGVATKDLTIDNYGNSTRIEKKASFNTMSNPMQRRASVLSDQKLEKLNEAIKFTSPTMMVPVDGPSNWTKITPEMWKQHGLSLGYLKYTNPDGNVVVRHASKILDTIKNDAIAKDVFAEELMSGMYETDKVAVNFTDMQEMWEYFGAHTDADAYQKIADIIGYHSGIETQNIDLSDAVYPNRPAFVAKIGYTSQEKSGSTKILPYAALTAPGYNISNSIVRVNQEFYGPMLQAEHSFDTTTTNEGLVTDDTAEDLHASRVSVMTQALASVIAEGMSKNETIRINQALADMSEANITGVLRQIVRVALKKYPSLKTEEDIEDNLLKELSTGKFVHNKELSESTKEYTRDLIASSLERSTNDPGLAAELLAASLIDSLTFDQKQLFPLFHSTLFSEFNKKGVRLKFDGGQYVVSPAHKFLPTYSLNLGKQVIVAGLSREDMNKYFYGQNFTSLLDGSVIQQAINYSFPLEKIVDVNKVKLSDIVVHNGIEEEFIHIKNRIRAEYNQDRSETKPSFKDYLTAKIAEGDYQFRFGRVSTSEVLGGNDQSTEDRLQYAKWYRWGIIPESGSQELQKISIFDTDEYRSYKAIDLIRDSFEDTSFNEFFGIDLTKPKAAIDSAIKRNVPIGLLKDYYFSNKSIPKKTIQDNNSITILSKAQEKEFSAWLVANKKNILNIIKDAYQYIGDNAITNTTFKDRFKTRLYNLLQDNSKGWVAEHTEVQMPHMHGDYFFIETGKDGKAATSIVDITGLRSIPSTNKYESLGILTREQAMKLSFNYEKHIDEVIAEMQNNKALTPAHLDLFNDEYVAQMHIYRENAREYFGNKVRLAYPAKSEAYNPKLKVIAKNNLFVFESYLLEDLLKEAKTKMKALGALNGSHYDALKSIIEKTEASIIARSQNLEFYNGKDIISIVRDRFITTKVNTLVNNFPKTLEFIMARIPGPAKQTYTAGKIKNFIFSSKNSIYGPHELLLLAGLDFDIDKQNIMTWAFDSDGRLYDWRDFSDKNVSDFSLKTLNTLIKESVDKVDAMFVSDRLRLENALKTLETKLVEQNLAGGEEYESIKTKINDVRVKQQSLESGIELIKGKEEARLRSDFTKSGQNLILHSMSEAILSPKNAIEASTPTSTEKPGNSTKLTNIRGLFTDKVSLTNIFLAQKITSNLNPFSTIQYEKENMVGKSGIGIFASDTKSYYATLTATLAADGDEELEHVKLKSDLPGLPTYHDAEYGINRNALQFFKQKPSTSTVLWDSSSTYTKGEVIKRKSKAGVFSYTAIADVPTGTDITDTAFWKLEPFVLTFNYISNAEKWSVRGMEISEKAKQAREKLKAIDEDDVEAQVDIINTYINDIKAFDKFNVDPQAWNDLSQLLNCATDNAKELILGRIGANNTTNSIISTMIRLGVPLEDALDIINDPSVEPLIKEVELESDTQTNSEERREREAAGIVEEDSFADRLIEKLRAKKDALSKPTSATAKPEDIVAYLTNPVRQLFTYVNASSEFSMLSKLLSINQGLKVSAYDVDAYVRSINKSMKRIIMEYNKTNPGSEIDFKFNLTEFITALEAKDVALLNQIYSNVNKVRTAVNVPFVLTKNVHFVSYFKALTQAQILRDLVTYVNTETNEVLDASGTNKSITEGIQARVTDTIYDIGILRYLKSRTGVDSQNGLFTLRGKNYDLSEPKATKTALGRLEFIQNLPSVIQEIKDNYFIDTLKYDSSIPDPSTNTSVVVLKGKDLRLIKDTRIHADLQEGLDRLRQTDKELYKALFYYSIITTKGSYAGGSYTALFPPEEYVDYEKFLKDNAAELSTEITNSREFIIRLNPLLLPHYSTLAPNYKGTRAIDEEGSEITDEPETDIRDDEEFFNANRGRSFVSRQDLNKKKFSIDHLNSKRLGKSTKPGETETEENLGMPNWWRSQSNGFVYRWNEALGIYIPLTSDVPDVAIKFRIPNDPQNIKVEDYGLTEGFKVNIDELSTGHIIAHITDGLLKRKSGDISNVLKASPYTAGKTKLSSNERSMYIVRSAAGALSVQTAESLGQYNPGAIFDEGFISTVPKPYSIDRIESDPEEYVYKRQNEYYTNRTLANKFSTEPGEKAEAIGIKLGKKISQGTRAVFDSETVNKFLSKVKSISKEYSEERLAEQFIAYKNNLIYNIVASRLEDVTPDMVKDAIDNKMDPRILDAVSSVRSTVDRKVGTNDISPILKLRVLYDGKRGFQETLDELKSVRKVRATYLDSISKHKDTLVTQPEINKIISNFLTNEVENNMTMLSVSDLKKMSDMIEDADPIFDDYIKNVFLDKFKMDCVIINDKVYLTTAAKIKATKQLDVAEHMLSKPLRVPPGIVYEYKKVANKEVFIALAKHLNNTLPGVTWKILSSKEIIDTYGDNYNEKGFFKVRGEIVINANKATLETPFHEYGHLYLEHLRIENETEYSRIMQLCKDHVLFDTMKKSYKYSSNADVAEEVFCELLSMEAASKLDDSTDPALSEIKELISNDLGVFGKVKKFLTDLFSKIFGVEIDLQMSNNLKDVIDGLASDVLFNKDSIINSFSQETKDSILKLKNDAELTLKEAKDILLSRGYIEWFCIN